MQYLTSIFSPDTAVISSDIRMEIAPGTFDAIVIRAVRRQQMRQPTLSYGSGQTERDLLHTRYSLLLRDL